MNAFARRCQNSLFDGVHELLFTDSAFLFDILKSCQKFIVHNYRLQAVKIFTQTVPKNKAGLLAKPA